MSTILFNRGPTLIGRGNVGAPSLSGDGSTVVFNQWDEENRQWEVMRYRDGETHNLTNDLRHDLAPEVDYDGDTVVWSRFSTESFSDPNGSFDVVRWRDGQVEVLGDGPGAETEAAVSGDGETVVWMVDDPKSPIGFDIQKWRRDEGVTDVTRGSDVDREPKVNHDGSRIFFTRRGGGREEFMMREHDEPAKSLTNTTMREWDPAVDARGETAVWSDERRGSHDLYLYQADGHRLSSVANEPWVHEHHADLSVDGNTIVYTRRERGKPTQLVLVENGEKTVLPFENVDFAEVSDDGTVLTWRAVEEGEARIYRWDRT